MPRPRHCCKVQMPPRVKGFIPIGYYATGSQEPIYLHLDEYETIRLLDYEGLSQVEAAELMNISRPTLTRIYERARQKIAQALTEARQILIEGGRTIFNGDWYECKKCECKFNITAHSQETICPMCNNKQVVKIGV